MKNIFALSSLALATLFMAVVPSVSAHGYVSQPPSRQLLCKDVPVPGCGDVRYEPQSVEVPKGSFACNGGGTRFHELNNEALWASHFSQVRPGTAPLSFTWTLTAPHRTSTWEYFLLTEGRRLLASFDGQGVVPPPIVVHNVPLDGHTGRQTILARWNIADTTDAVYACVDLDIEPTRRYNATVAIAGPAAATQIPIGVCP